MTIPAPPIAIPAICFRSNTSRVMIHDSSAVRIGEMFVSRFERAAVVNFIE